MNIRYGENPKGWFRCERYYHTEEGWWFQTREKTEQGPFSSHIEAENELCLYIRKMNLYSNSVGRIPNQL